MVEDDKDHEKNNKINFIDIVNNNNNNNTNNRSISFYPHQVGGHFFGKGKTKLRILQTCDGIVLKPLQMPPKGDREHNFYKKMFTSNESDLNQDEKELRNFLPFYRGSCIHNETIYLKMDDLAFGIKYPAVIDIKIGKQTYDPEATIEQMNKHKMKCPYVQNIGFQIDGMRVYNKIDKSFDHFDKSFGRALNEEDSKHGLALYYQYHQNPQPQAIKETLKKLIDIKNWFEKQTSYNFYSSSVIIVYEANLEELFNNKNIKENQPATIALTSPLTSIDQNQSATNKSSLKYSSLMRNSNGLIRVIMADFAHVFQSNSKSRDENYLFGISKLIDYLKSISRQDYSFKDIRDYPQV